MTMLPGMGGIPPRPPGYVPPGLPDTAAGSTNIFRGRLVLVFGPTGTVSGIFVYAAGTTPAFGNTPIVSITNSTVDPFGNPVQPTIQITGTGTLEVGSAPNAQIQLRTSGGVSGIIEFLLNNAGFNDALVSSAVIGGVFAALNMQGPASTVVGHRDRVRVQLNSSDGVSSFGNVQFVYSDDSATDRTYMFVDGGGVGIQACQQLTAANPSIVASAVTPAISETWHDLRPLSNNFVGSIAGAYPPQYRKLADGNVQIVGSVQTPTAVQLPNPNGTAWGTLGASWRPGSNDGFYFPVHLVTNVTPVGTPVVQIHTNGTLTFQNLPTTYNALIVHINAIFPLDNTGLIPA